MEIPLKFAQARSFGGMIRRELDERRWSSSELWRRLSGRAGFSASRVLVWSWTRDRKSISPDLLPHIFDLFGWEGGVRLHAFDLAAASCSAIEHVRSIGDEMGWKDEERLRAYERIIADAVDRRAA